MMYFPCCINNANRYLSKESIDGIQFFTFTFDLCLEVIIRRKKSEGSNIHVWSSGIKWDSADLEKQR